MTKNIIIGILAFISIFLVVFANIKAEEANKQTMQAQLNLELANQNMTIAKEEERKAVEAAATARIAERKASQLQEQLDNCK